MKHADPAYVFGKDVNNVRILAKSDVSEFLGGEEFIDEWIQLHNFEYGFEAIKMQKFAAGGEMRRHAHLLGKKDPRQQYLIADFV